MSNPNSSKDNRPVAVHLPDWSQGNPYQRLLAEGIEAHGWRVLFADYPDGMMPLRRVLKTHPEARAVHLHWIAPYVAHLFWSSSTLRFYAKLLLLMLDVLYCRAKGRRTVWTVHNRLAHESPHPVRERLFRAFLARTVNHLVFHSTGALEAFRSEISKVPDHKVSIIPHGNYVDVYENSQGTKARLARELGIDTEHRVVLFFGAVRRYKGLPTLIGAFERNPDPNLRLLIAGKPFEESLTQEIMLATRRDRRILTYLDFIPDDEVAPLHDLADIVALPFERTLTSGSVLLAMSLGKALLLPESARVLDVVGDEGALFFRSESELFSQINALGAVPVAQLGSHNLDAARLLSWKRIGQQTARLY